MKPPLNRPFSGLHHVSALTKDAARNHDFYTRVLGLRLVKKTVNQDDPTMYHLFYGDGAGSPGSEVTFFEFPRAAREKRGVNSITRTALRVTGAAALRYWEGRLTAFGVAHGGLTERDGRLHLDLEDPDGTRLSLVEDGGVGPRAAPNPRTDVPTAFQLQGLGYSVLSVSDPKPTRTLLERGLTLRPVRRYDHDGHVTHVFAMGEDNAKVGPHAELHLQVHQGGPRRRPGAGAVHHVALRVASALALAAWAAHLTREGFVHSGIIDRLYFRSLYVRGDGGLVIELATDGPGLDVDEPLERLGERLALPPFLEGRRADIERRLRPLTPTPLTPPQGAA